MFYGLLRGCSPLAMTLGERSLVQQREHHARAEVLTGGVLECRAVEQHEQRARFNLVGLRDAAECLGEGGQVARELRADAAVGKEGALLQEFLVHLVGGGSAEAEGLHECFREPSLRTRFAAPMSGLLALVVSRVFRKNSLSQHQI